MALAHFDHKRISVGAFVVIGIISTVRHVITEGTSLAATEAEGEQILPGQ